MPETSRSSYSRETPPPLPSRERQNEREELRDKIKIMEIERDRLLGIGVDVRSIALEELTKRIARLKAELATGRIASVDIVLDDIEEPVEEVGESDILSTRDVV